jgi:Zn-finger nucleic acid-binding protein
MKCPVCREPDLVMSERQGIEIDYCPKCRGVWLDRGELDKLIDRAAPQAAPPSAQEPPRDYRDDDDRYRRGYKRKRGGFLGEIFDFD